MDLKKVEAFLASAFRTFDSSASVWKVDPASEERGLCQLITNSGRKRLKKRAERLHGQVKKKQARDIHISPREEVGRHNTCEIEEVILQLSVLLDGMTLFG